jgi:CHASE2 domain-containing sensor protein
MTDMVISDVNNLLAIAALAGGVAILMGRLEPAQRATGLFMLIAAGLFGTALGLRAILADFPIPPGPRFVTMAACGTLAFYRSCRWIQDQLA